LPGLGSTYLLQRIVGPAKARELMLTAKVILAPEAAAMGLINKVVAEDKLMEEARAMAKQMAECNPKTISAIKDCLHHGATSTLEQAMKYEQETDKRMRILRTNGGYDFFGSLFSVAIYNNARFHAG